MAALEGSTLRAMDLHTASSARCFRPSACVAPAHLCKRLEPLMCSLGPHRFELRVVATCRTPCIGTLPPGGALRGHPCPSSRPVLSYLCAGRRHSGRAAARQARRRLQPAAAAAPEVASLPAPAPAPDLPEPTGEWSLLPWAETAEFQRDHLAWAHKRCGACLGHAADTCREAGAQAAAAGMGELGSAIPERWGVLELAAPGTSAHLHAELAL